MTNNPPIILFCYNRPRHLSLAINSLKNCVGIANHDLYVFSDGPKSTEDSQKVNEVREIVRNITGFKSKKIIESKANSGLAQSVIQGVSYVLEKYTSAIIIEDDLEFDKYFLIYMSETLRKYENESTIFSISGYSPIDVRNICHPFQTYLSTRVHSWGWGIWSDRWKQIDWNLSNLGAFFRDKSKVSHLKSGGPDLIPMTFSYLKSEIDSWAIRMAISASNSFSFCIYPAWSLVNNIGLDGSGTNCGLEENNLIKAPFRDTVILNFAPIKNSNPIVTSKFYNSYL